MSDITALTNQEEQQKIGDMIQILNGQSIPVDYIESGLIVSQSSYPQLFANLGLLKDGIENWTSYYNNEFIYSLTYSNGLYVYGGNSGVLRTSTDGITWTARTSGVTTAIKKLIYGDGLFVYSASNYMGISNNAITWTKIPTGLIANEYTQYKIIYDGQKFISSGILGVNVSLNGREWSNYFSTNISFNYALIYNNGLYIVGGSNGLIKTSTDLVTWTTRSIGENNNDFIRSLTYGNGLYVYGGSNGVLGTSTDGITWTARTSGTTQTIQTLTYGNGLYVYGGSNGVLGTSTDGITWTARTSGTTQTINALTYGDGLYIYGGSSGVLGTSADGIIWETRTSGTNQAINTLTYGDGLYVYGGNSGVLDTSTDGITWTARTSGTTEAIRTLTYGDGLYVYSGDNGFTGTSTDGITWTIPITNDALTYGDGLYITAGKNGIIHTSTNGITWETRTSGTNQAINALAYGNGLYIYGGNNGVLDTSTDGITWTARTSGTTEAIRTLTYGDGLYVYGTNTNIIGVSSDSINWSMNGISDTSINSITYGDGLFVLVGGGSKRFIYSSINGTDWYKRFDEQLGLDIKDVVYGNNEFVACRIQRIYKASSRYTYNTQIEFKTPTIPEQKSTKYKFYIKAK